jgi:2-polyprenyl-3-methyl-5-hydroxy-6-metoxy-1,4-benzoquinol methylase
MLTCPYCKDIGNSYFAIYSRIYYRCLGCDLIFQSHTKSYENAVSSYNKDYFQRYSADQTEGSRDVLFNHALDLIEARKQRGRLLDVGTGCGFFLVAAQKRGWDAKGIEPSIQSVEVARRQNTIDIFPGTLHEYDKIGQHDVISFINVLDHSTMPWLEIDRAKKLLRPGGLIYLRFPNGFVHSRIYLLAHKFGLSNSLLRFLVFHAYSFTPRYIKRLLHDYGFVQTTVDSSPPSEGDPYYLFPAPSLAFFMKRFLHTIAVAAQDLSKGKMLLGTSLEVTAISSTSQ